MCFPTASNDEAATFFQRIRSIGWPTSTDQRIANGPGQAQACKAACSVLNKNSKLMLSTINQKAAGTALPPPPASPPPTLPTSPPIGDTAVSTQHNNGGASDANGRVGQTTGWRTAASSRQKENKRDVRLIKGKGHEQSFRMKHWRRVNVWDTVQDSTSETSQPPPPGLPFFLQCYTSAAVEVEPRAGKVTIFSPRPSQKSSNWGYRPLAVTSSGISILADKSLSLSHIYILFFHDGHP